MFVCRHAQDVRELYERKLERANNLYMELCACMLQMEKRERELAKSVFLLLYSFFHWFIDSFIHWFIHSIAHSLNRSFSSIAHSVQSENVRSAQETCKCLWKLQTLWAQPVTDGIAYELLRRLFHVGNFCFWVRFFKQLLLKNCAVDFVEICNVYIRKAIIKAAKRIFNSDKICRS